MLRSIMLEKMLIIVKTIYLIYLFELIAQVEATQSFGKRYLSALDLYTAHPFKGKHLVVSGTSGITLFNIKRNSTGYIIQISGVGVLLMEWMAQYYEFTFSYLQVTQNAFETVGNVSGLISYVTKGECDILVSASITANRIPFLAFTHPVSYLPINYLIQAAKPAINFQFIFQPFTYWVWIALIVSLLSVLPILYGFNWYLTSHKALQNRSFKRTEKGSVIKNAFMYVIAIFLRQPYYCSSKKFMVRWLVASWCIATFLIGTIYSCLLISFITSPHSYPMINSISDIPKRSDVHLVMNKGLNVEAVILGADSGLLKQLGDNLRSYPKSSCPTTAVCVDLVKAGFHAYIASSNTFLADAMRTDYLAARECNLQMGKESFMNLPIPCAISKNSPYLDDFNKGIMRTNEAGLLMKAWPRKFEPDVRRCTSSKQDESSLSAALSLQELALAFIILASGYMLSFMFLLAEKLFKTLKIFKLMGF